jgi:hypothetical protein
MSRFVVSEGEETGISASRPPGSRYSRAAHAHKREQPGNYFVLLRRPGR